MAGNLFPAVHRHQHANAPARGCGEIDSRHAGELAAAGDPGRRFPSFANACFAGAQQAFSFGVSLCPGLVNCGPSGLTAWSGTPSRARNLGSGATPKRLVLRSRRRSRKLGGVYPGLHPQAQDAWGWHTRLARSELLAVTREPERQRGCTPASRRKHDARRACERAPVRQAHRKGDGMRRNRLTSREFQQPGASGASGICRLRRGPTSDWREWLPVVMPSQRMRKPHANMPAVRQAHRKAMGCGEIDSRHAGDTTAGDPGRRFPSFASASEGRSALGLSIAARWA